MQPLKKEKKQRGMEEVNAQLAKETDVEVRESTVKAGAQLLSEFSASMNITLRPEELKVYLELLITDTEFEDAVIMYRGTSKPNTFRTFPAFSYKMQTIVGHYPHQAYNVWFQRSEGKWILNYNKVPQEGNWRG